MRGSFILLLLAAAPSAFPAPASRPAARDLLAPDAEAHWVPFEITPGNQIRFTITIDDRPVAAILDTGVSNSVLSRAYADAAKLKTSAGGTANAIGGVVAIGWADTRSIVLGGLTRTGARIGVASLPATATGSTTPVEMLVGRDLTAEYALDIDYDAKRFRLLRSGRMPFHGLSAPLRIAPGRQVYVSEMAISAKRLRPLIVDTGDGNAVTLSSEAVRAAAITTPVRTTTISYGLGGAIVTDLAIVPEARFGMTIAKEVEVQIEPPGGFSHSIGMAGRIGSGLLQRYRVLLDPGAGHMVLAPGARAGVPPLRSTSGILVALETGRLRVLHVMRGSPAAASGWKAGDAICRVDGTPIPADYATNPLAGWSIGAPGRIVSLELCDGTTRALTLRRFY